MSADEEETRTHFLLAHSRPVPFRLGAGRELEVFRPPTNRTPHFTSSYADFLNSRSSRPHKYPHVGESSNPESLFTHLHCRNRLALRNNFLFEATNASLRIITEPSERENWKKVNTAISTRSTITDISISDDATYGIATTLKTPVVFSISPDDEPKFNEAVFLSYKGEVSQCAVNDFMIGESVMLSPDGKVVIYDVDVVTYCSEPEDGFFSQSSICFACHPRVLAASGNENIQIIDARCDPNQSQIKCPVIGATSLMSLDINQIAAVSQLGCYLVDTRFPSEPVNHFRYEFDSKPSSISFVNIDDFSVIVSGACESSEVVFFPYSDTTYCAPLRPFDAILQSFYSVEPEFLTGISIESNVTFLQYESDSLIGINLDIDEQPCKHFISTMTRYEDETPRDDFIFDPCFAKLPSTGNDDQNVTWMNAFPEIKNPPPDSFLYPSPDPPQEEDVGNGYLIELEGALDFENADIEQALPLFWNNHLKAARVT